MEATICFFSAPKIPKLGPLPTAPSADSDSVLQRKRREEELLAASGGTAGTVKTNDLSPSSLVGQRKVLLGV
jgi:hypothetical protein